MRYGRYDVDESLMPFLGDAFSIPVAVDKEVQVGMEIFYQGPATKTPDHAVPCLVVNIPAPDRIVVRRIRDYDGYCFRLREDSRTRSLKHLRVEVGEYISFLFNEWPASMSLEEHDEHKKNIMELILLYIRTTQDQKTPRHTEQMEWNERCREMAREAITRADYRTKAELDKAHTEENAGLQIGHWKDV